MIRTALSHGLLALFATLASVSSARADGSFDLQVGGAATVSPKYEGSKDYEVRGFPIVAPAGTGSDGMVQFRGVDDIRFRAFQSHGFEAGPLAGYRFGRDEDDADRLEGLGDVDGSLVIGAYAAYTLGGPFGDVKPFVSYHYGVTGDDTGAVLRFGAETKIPVCKCLDVTAIVGATYADSDYMDAYFGVSNDQAISSALFGDGLAAGEADAGIKDIYVSLATDIPLTDVWSLKLAGRYAHLVGDAADSSIVETESQLSGLVGLTYRFSVDR